MIKATDLVKRFDHFTALETLNTEIPSGSIYGLVGPNGSGKSTFMRLICGVYRPDGGSIEVDGEPVFENTGLKNRIFFVSDDLYFIPQCTLDEMARFYSGIYSSFNQAKYHKLLEVFPIPSKKRVNTFSKGMKRQAALILALACQPEYLLLDEAFDGLDPIIRIALRRVVADEMVSRGMTVLISSHNLRELEDLCDHVGLLHKGKILFERDLDELKLGFCKVQAAFRPMISRDKLEGLSLMKFETRGSLIDMVVRGNREEVLAYLETFHPLFAEAIPLTLEEVFIHEMEAVGYDYNNVLF